MMRLRKKLFILLVFFILLIGGIITLALWDGNQHFAYASSTEAIDRVRVAQKQGNSIELQEKDINSILGVYVGKGKSKGNVTVRGLTATFGENSMAIKMPLQYKGVNLLFSAGGKIAYLQNENNIEFEPSFYKIGSLPIPRKLVQALLEKNSFKGVELKNTSIKISASLIPFTIKDIAFKNNSIVLALKKIDILASLLPKITPQKDSPKVDLPPTVPSKSENPAAKQSETAAVAKPNPDTQKSISDVNNQLAAAASTLQSSKEKAVLQKIMATMSSINSNSTYNYTSDVGQVNVMYKALTKQERTSVKLALMSNVDMNTALKLKNTFGL